MRMTLVNILAISLGALLFCAQNSLAQAPQNIYAFTVKDINGNDVSLSNYQGKVLLIVNTASHCGFTVQYGPLEKLYQNHKDKGFVVLGFPANNFMNQEPGTDAEIKDFCFRTFQTTFPLFSKISVKGDDIHPLYQYLTTQTQFTGPITWNFNKFLVDRTGEVVARFSSQTGPLSPEIVSAVEAELAQ